MGTGLNRTLPAFGASASKLRSSKLLLVQLGLESRKDERRTQSWKEAVYGSGRGVMVT